MRWASLGLVLALTSGVAACSTHVVDPERTGTTAGAPTPSPLATEAPSSTPVGYVAPSVRQPIQAFVGDDAATVRAIRAGLKDIDVATELKDGELIAVAKGFCSVASSGGAVASKIDFWAAYTRIPGDVRDVAFSRGTSAYCPRVEQSVAASRDQQQALDDRYVPGLPLEARTDLVRFALAVVDETTPTSLARRSDDRIVADMQATCAAWVSSPRVGAVEAAVDAPSTETYTALDVYAAFVMLGHCPTQFEEFRSTLQNTPAPDTATARRP